MTPYATIAGLHDLWRGRHALPSAYLVETLARIDRLDPLLRAFITLDRDGAAASADESDRRFAAGAARRLEGVPVAVKSNIAVKGLPWDAGMELRRHLTANADADAVRRLREAGAVVLGTLNMQEAALGATTDNVWFGRALNPHGLGSDAKGRTPGGSSGGSGAAVAAGLCVVALGTDTLGSIRIPSAYNGVFGLKPTNGAVSSDGLAPLSDQLDCIGPLARSLDDLRRVSEILAPLPAATPISRLLLLDELGGIGCEPAVLQAYHAARNAAKLPCETLSLTDPTRTIRTAALIMALRDFTAHLGADWRDRSDGLSSGLRFLLEYGEARSVARFAQDTEVFRRTRAAVRAAVPPGCALLLPTAPQAAFVQGTEAPLDQADFTGLANIAGLPALAIPAGRDADGMPVGVQIVGAPGSEAALFDLAATLDSSLAGYAPPPLD